MIKVLKMWQKNSGVGFTSTEERGGHFVFLLEVAAENSRTGETAGRRHVGYGHLGMFGEEAAGIFETQIAHIVGQRTVTAALG